MVKDVRMMELPRTLAKLFLGMLCTFIFPYIEKVCLPTL